jgi:hypothetical protein
MRTYLLSLYLFFSLYPSHAQENSFFAAPIKVGTNQIVHPSLIDQTEVFITKSPLNEDTFFVACNTLNFNPFFISEGIYVTNNSGANWRGNDTCEGYPIGYHGGDPGIAIDEQGTFVLTRLGQSPFVGLYSHRSTDHGLTWSSQRAISTDDLERAALLSDCASGSPWKGRTYAAWATFTQPFPVMFAYTDNGAVNWSTQSQVNNPSRRCAGGDLAIGPGGALYLCWAGVTDVSPFKEVLVGFASSTDGGQSWNVTENAFPISGISGAIANKGNIRVNSLPGITVDTTNGPRRGWIYIATTQKDLQPAGSDPDIVLFRSSDGGTTWSSGVRVNQDPLNNGKTQYFPAVHVDPSGAIDILFYDDRTTTNDSVGVFLARSLDGGDTWIEFEISDHHFKPVPIGGLGQGYQGDNIDISSNSSTLLPVWMDNSTGKYQIWTVPVRYGDIDAIGDKEKIIPNGIRKISPNPFSGITDITFQVNKASRVSLQLFEVTGKHLLTILDEEKVAGLHNIRVDLQALAPGIFYCVMNSEEGTSTRKIVKVQ